MVRLLIDIYTVVFGFLGAVFSFYFFRYLLDLNGVPARALWEWRDRTKTWRYVASPSMFRGHEASVHGPFRTALQACRSASRYVKDNPHGEAIVQFHEGGLWLPQLNREPAKYWQVFNAEGEQKNDFDECRP